MKSKLKTPPVSQSHIAQAEHHVDPRLGLRKAEPQHSDGKEQDWDLDLEDEGLREYFATSVHEAGHAVAGELLGFRCRYIKGAFCTHDRRGTRLLRYWPKSPKAFSQNVRYGVKLIAGIAAEAIDDGGEITYELRTGPGEIDYKKVTAIAERLSWCKIDPRTLQPERSAASLIAEWEAKAIELLQANWVWVSNVAEMFIDFEGRLSGDDVRSCKPSEEEDSEDLQVLVKELHR